jgi:hypothetical protein
VPGDLLRIEAKPRAATGPEAARPELIGMVIDPAPTDTPPLRDLLSADQLPPSRWPFLGREDLGEAQCECLN